MAVSYAWTFNPFTTTGDTQTISAIPWVLTASDGLQASSHSDTTPLPPPAPKDFIPFEKVTMQNAIDWVSAIIDVSTLKATLSARLGQQAFAKTGTALPPLIEKPALGASAPATPSIK